MTLVDYQKWAGPVFEGLTKVARFLTSAHLQLPRSALSDAVDSACCDLRHAWKQVGDGRCAKIKIERWFWCGVFGELYGGAVETRSAKDLQEVLAWIDDGPDPDTVRDANFASN